MMDTCCKYANKVHVARRRFIQLYFNYAVRKAKAAGKFEALAAEFKDVKDFGMAMVIEAERLPRARKNKAAFEMVMGRVAELTLKAYA